MSFEESGHVSNPVVAHDVPTNQSVRDMIEKYEKQRTQEQLVREEEAERVQKLGGIRKYKTFEPNDPHMTSHEESLLKPTSMQESKDIARCDSDATAAPRAESDTATSADFPTEDEPAEVEARPKGGMSMADKAQPTEKSKGSAAGGRSPPEKGLSKYFMFPKLPSKTKSKQATK